MYFNDQYIELNVIMYILDIGVFQSLFETELEEISKVSQSPLGNMRRKHHILTPRQSERNLGTVEIAQSSLKSRKSSRFQIGGFGKPLLLYYILESSIYLQSVCQHVGPVLEVENFLEFYPFR